MSYYVIGIGGSGSKCAEALVHTLAAVPLDQPVSILLVDPDTANGNLTRAVQTLDAYTAARPAVLGERALLRTLLKPTEPRVWTPFTDEARPVFRDLFQYEFLSQRHPVAAGLMDVLYSEQEKTAPLDKGFLGHPSIGAAVLADAANLIAERPWKDFCNAMRNDPQARVFLFGSIFGGTGASGLPTLARLLADHLADRRDQFAIGSTLLLPYFSFPANDNREQLQARSDEFVLRAQAALGYYQDKLDAGDRAIYDAVYVLGSNVPANVGNNSLGASNQRNPAHYVELYAATAALHFFGLEVGPQPRTFLTARTSTALLGWDSLPEGFVLRDALANLARFAYAYLGYFYPRLAGQLKNPGSLGKTTWFVRYFDRGQASAYAQPLERLADYCSRFLIWLDALHATDDGLAIRYFDTSTYTVEQTAVEFPPNATAGFGRLYPVSARGLHRSFEELSSAMDRSNPRDQEGVSDFGRFVGGLYHECRAS